MSASTARLLDDARGVRAMTGVIAIMLFLTVLTAASGLAARNAARSLDRQLAGRLTVQLLAGSDTARIASALADSSGVRRVRVVPPAELARLLAPYLGSDAGDPDLPIPALIDVDLADAGSATAAGVERAARAIAPGARVDRHAAWMAPVGRLLATVTWLAASLVGLMLAATAAVIVLAARAGLDAHRETIEVMHMLGSTDVQVARLFQRRVARDAAIGGAIGSVTAFALILFLGTRVAALGSDLLGAAVLGAGGWAALALLPLVFVLLAMAAARFAVTGALRRLL